MQIYTALMNCKKHYKEIIELSCIRTRQIFIWLKATITYFKKNFNVIHLQFFSEH